MNTTSETQEAPARKLSELTPAEQLQCRKHFVQAAIHRAQQWDEEKAIELLLGHEIDVDFQNWAWGLDAPYPDVNKANLNTIIDLKDLGELLDDVI
jgi:hypothetical protein